MMRYISLIIPLLLPLLFIIGCHNGMQQTDGAVRESDEAYRLFDSSRSLRGLPADFQRGVNYAHVHRNGHGYGSDVSATELGELARIGVEWIAITPFGYQERVTDDALWGYNAERDVWEAGNRDITATNIRREVAAAHARGIRVMLKPQIWSRAFGDGGEWHGTIHQESTEGQRKWWASYSAFVLYYAALAKDAGADAYCIGTELVAITRERDSDWRGLIARVRSTVAIPLTYAAHWDKEFERIGFWDALDWVGINAYFPLDAPDTASVPRLAAAWGTHAQRISRFSQRVNRPIIFTEAGYRPVLGAQREPWLHNGGKPDSTIQSRLIEAMFVALCDSSWWKGLYIWKAFTDPNMARRYGENTDFTFRHRPAEQVIKRWYTSGPDSGRGSTPAPR